MNKHIIDGQNELLILVDNQDNEIGVNDKLSVHLEGLLHRAFSIFIFNSQSELLIQQRADGKYHSPGLWTNTCCSHPRPGEGTIEACNRRLLEEMGIGAMLQFSFSFLYKYEFSNGLIEHEFDHVYIGYTDQQPEINLNEVQSWKYISIGNLETEIGLNPDLYTPWLKICITELKENLLSKYKK
jgi:isopentenyl-diphosphate delta-isomerase